ncbi:hypothetical protein [Tahibacter caeni]|uniref:hypothetical protein n=1 Tax=Tahibacter caeni TaxID=1453545 RepID=UPI00214815D1|nr:hypothetical protein [Tahibacter caeni]
MRFRFCSAVAAVVGLVVAGAVAAGPIADRITTVTLTLPATLADTAPSACLGGYCRIGPRLYLAPRSDGSHWLGWTDSGGNGHVSLLANGAIAGTFDYAGEEARGLVAHDDGGFAVLLRRASDSTIRLTRRSAGNAAAFSTAIANPVAIAQMNLGDARLAYGNSRYAAYFAVHGISGIYDGHEGDQLAYIGSSGSVLGGGWSWGCSHQMAGLVGYHPGLNAFGALCVSDCYASKGILYNNSRNLFGIDGGCDGTVWGQFGQLAAGDATWKLAFVAQGTPAFPAQGVGLLSFTASAAVAPTVSWLTNTGGLTERDPVLARIGSGAPERFLVGWRNDSTFQLALVDGSGAYLAPPENVAGVSWGDRDDPLRSTADGKVAWVSAAAGTRTLKLHVYAERGDAVFASGFQ